MIYPALEDHRTRLASDDPHHYINIVVRQSSVAIVERLIRVVKLTTSCSANISGWMHERVSSRFVERESFSTITVTDVFFTAFICFNFFLVRELNIMSYNIQEI